MYVVELALDLVHGQVLGETGHLLQALKLVKIRSLSSLPLRSLGLPRSLVLLDDGTKCDYILLAYLVGSFSACFSAGDLKLLYIFDHALSYVMFTCLRHCTSSWH